MFPPPVPGEPADRTRRSVRDAITTYPLVAVAVAFITAYVMTRIAQRWS